MPVITPDMHAQMESMMKDTKIMNSVASMMKNMDPEAMRELGFGSHQTNDPIETLKMPSSSKASRPPVELITPRLVHLKRYS